MKERMECKHHPFLLQGLTQEKLQSHKARLCLPLLAMLPVQVELQPFLVASLKILNISLFSQFVPCFGVIQFRSREKILPHSITLS